MIHEVFPMTYAFHRQPRGRGQVVPHHPVTLSWPEVEGESSGPGTDPRHRARPLTPASQARADKIAQLRHAVESGAYCVSAEQIAERMVQAALADMLT
jgi:hypothetical protein